MEKENSKEEYSVKTDKNIKVESAFIQENKELNLTESLNKVDNNFSEHQTKLNCKQNAVRLDKTAVLQGFFLFIITIIIVVLGYTPDAGIDFVASLLPFTLFIILACFLYYISEAIRTKTIYQLISYILGLLLGFSIIGLSLL